MVTWEHKICVIRINVLPDGTFSFPLLLFVQLAEATYVLSVYYNLMCKAFKPFKVLSLFPILCFFII